MGASILLVGILTVGADRGAELVFRYGVGVANEAPPASDHENADGHDTEHERPPHPHGASPSDTASDHHAGQPDVLAQPNPGQSEAAVNADVDAAVSKSQRIEKRPADRPPAQAPSHDHSAHEH